MTREWTFGKRVGFGFAVTATILILVSLIGYLSTESLISNDLRVKHTYEVQAKISHFDRLLKDAESSQRGFTLTAREEYLKPFQESVEQLPTVLEELASLVVDNPKQTRRVEELREATLLRLSQLSERIETTQHAGIEAALKQISSGVGKQTMDQIRSLVSQMENEESQLFEARRSRMDIGVFATKLAILGGCMLGLLATFFVARYTVTTLTREIGTAVQQVQSSSAELQAVAKQQATSAKEQASAMNEIATTLTELLVTSQQIAESSVRVSHIAMEATEVAQEGDKIVDTSRQSIIEIAQQVERLVEHMLDLGKKSQHIGSVVDIVSELAEQTNILAINATIEAAGAGESGRRFSVVADEIRKLAERVTGSAREIRTLIDDVQSAVSTSVMATEAGSKSVELGTRNFSDLTASLKQIVDVSLSTMDAAREIELSTKQQATAVEQVNVAIGSVHQATLETEASSAQTLQTASQLSQLSRTLRRIIIAEKQPSFSALEVER